MIGHRENPFATGSIRGKASLGRRQTLDIERAEMKKEARILEYRVKELRTASHLANVLSALMSDIALGNVMPKEAREIQKEINERLKVIEQGVRGVEVVKKLKTLEEKVGREKERR